MILVVYIKELASREHVLSVHAGRKEIQYARTGLLGAASALGLVLIL